MKKAEKKALLKLLHAAKDWSKAYPLDTFPEPDFDKANKVLKQAAISLDDISASNMRHVLKSLINTYDIEFSKNYPTR